MNIGKQIRYLRIRKSARQEDLADYLGVSCQAVSKWETGASLPDITLLPRLAVYLGVTIDDLFRLSEEDQMERIENALYTDIRLDDCMYQAYVEFLENLTERKEYEIRAHYLLALVYNHRAYADRQAAVMHAERAVELDPAQGTIDAFPALIEAHQGHCGDEWLDNHSALIEYLKRFLNGHPGHYRCLYALCENLLADRRYAEAEAYVDMLAGIPERMYQAEIYRGDIAQGRGDMNAALVHWNRSVENHPEVWQAWCSRADRLKLQGRYEEALSDYEKCCVMQSAPHIIDGLYSRAQLFEQLGRYDEAIRERKRIIGYLTEEFGLNESEGVKGQEREIERIRTIKNA